MVFIPIHPNCFISPTVPILTAKGWQELGKIELGELVLTHKKRFKQVTNKIVISNQNIKLVTFYVEGKFNDVEWLEVTAEHPILTDSGWKKAEDLIRYDKVFRVFEYGKELDFTEHSILNIGHLELENQTLYNLSVADDESFIANGFVVHNCRCDWIPVVDTIEYPKSFYQRAGLPVPRKVKPKPTGEKINNIITSGEFTNTTHLGGGANESFTTELVLNNKKVKGVYKAASGEAELRDIIPVGTYYKREVAASWLDEEYLKFNIVPKTVIRTGPNGIGSVQRFAANTKTIYETAPTTESVRKTVFFDLLVGNTDRHIENILIKGGKAIAIDNGLAFPHTVEGSLFTGYRQQFHKVKFLGQYDAAGKSGWKLTTEMRQALQRIIKDEERIRTKLEYYLNDTKEIRRLGRFEQQDYQEMTNAVDSFFLRAKILLKDGYIKEYLEYK